MKRLCAARFIRLCKVSDDIGRRYTFNTAIAAVMELFNAVSRGNTDTLPVVLCSAKPWSDALAARAIVHVAQVLWEALGRDGLIMDTSSPC